MNTEFICEFLSHPYSFAYVQSMKALAIHKIKFLELLPRVLAVTVHITK